MTPFYLTVSTMAIVGFVLTSFLLNKNGMTADTVRNWPLLAYTGLSVSACLPFEFGVQVGLAISAALVAAISVVELTWPGLMLKMLHIAASGLEAWLEKNMAFFAFLLAVFCFLSGSDVLQNDDVIGAALLFGATVTLAGFSIVVLMKSSPDTSAAPTEISAEAPNEAVGAGR